MAVVRRRLLPGIDAQRGGAPAIPAHARDENAACHMKAGAPSTSYEQSLKIFVLRAWAVCCCVLFLEQSMTVA